MREARTPLLPSDLPWESNSYLLLDGVSVKDLPQKLYLWSDNPLFEPLYLDTEWHELVDLSPCLIRVDGLSDPVMQAFLANAGHECGYVIFTTARFDDVVRHLRWLLQVETAEHQGAILRLADPAVAHPLFAIGNSRFFGPIEHVCTPDSLEERWHQYQRPGIRPEQDHAVPYRLSDTEMKALGDVSFRQTIQALDEHMREFFPCYQSDLRGRERYRHLRDLADQAYRRNLCSEREILLFANIFGFLGEQALEQHSDIAQLLKAPSPLSIGERVEHAAFLAEQRTIEIQGMTS